ncbi:hypothetical protein LPJ66_004763 [Kickxella alabastrina]|uniref:Uncharacterized protein n=1 Tax=Kickxella alabastrina TaxID=61397 RepID=A0ACC1IGG2_9FUNG|nr:hypothetical protein LPJ66_004763 [Kickxella alabastrina]
MLSNGISSRLQQFQHYTDNERQDDLAQLALGHPAAGFGRQASYARIPARKGLAADLINKFNRLSKTTPEQQAALVKGFFSPQLSSGRSAGCFEFNVNSGAAKMAQQLGHSPRQIQEQKQKQAQSQSQSQNQMQQQHNEQLLVLGDNLHMKPKPNPEPVPVPEPEPEPETDMGAMDIQTDGMPPPKDGPGSGLHPRTELPLGSHIGIARESLFLSDTQLDRALFEIHEFSRNMNILLDSDDM